MSDYVARRRTIMYSYNVNTPDENLEGLVILAKSGDVKVAREGLREFTKKHPNKLLAWKWLADIASSVKERSGAIRRAQLLAPGDPWVIEAKKHSRPPGYRKDKYSGVENSATLYSEKIDNEEIVEHIEDSIEVDKISDTNSDSKSVSLEDKLEPKSINSPDVKIYSQKDQQIIETRQKSEQPSWLIWVAAIMGIAGFVLLTIAWSMSQ